MLSKSTTAITKKCQRFMNNRLAKHCASGSSHLQINQGALSQSVAGFARKAEVEDPLRGHRRRGRFDALRGDRDHFPLQFVVHNPGREVSLHRRVIGPFDNTFPCGQVFCFLVYSANRELVLSLPLSVFCPRLCADTSRQSPSTQERNS